MAIVGGRELQAVTTGGASDFGTNKMHPTAASKSNWGSLRARVRGGGKCVVKHCVTCEADERSRGAVQNLINCAPSCHQWRTSDFQDKIIPQTVKLE